MLCCAQIAKTATAIEAPTPTDGDVAEVLRVGVVAHRLRARLEDGLGRDAVRIADLQIRRPGA